MIEKVKEYAAKAWAYIKAAFGHSKIVAVNVAGAVLVILSENIDFLLGTDWSLYFEHDVSALISAGVMIVNIYLRIYKSGGVVSFKPEVAPNASGAGMTNGTQNTSGTGQAGGVTNTTGEGMQQPNPKTGGMNA